MLRSHLTLAVKVLGRRPFFTFVSLVGVTLTLLVLTVAAALVDHLFGPLAPETRQERTLVLASLELTGGRSSSTGWPGYAFLDRYARGLPGVERLAVTTQARSVFSYVGGERVRSYLRHTDAEFWRVLEFRFLEGGPFLDEDVAAARPLAVINASTRERFFGGAPALGRTLEIDGQRFRVAGVVPDVPFLRLVPFADVWVPLSTLPGEGWRRDLRGGFLGILLARDRADFPAIRSELAARLPTVDLAGTPFTTAYAVPETLFETMARLLLRTGRGQRSLADRLTLTLAGLALAFMALPALNLVNLSLSRALERAAEIGVRRAFGATRAGILVQFVLENLLLTLLGGLLALGLAQLALRALTASGLLPYADLHLNWRVFAWGLGFALAFGVLSGAYPAWRLARLHPVEALRGGR